MGNDDKMLTKLIENVPDEVSSVVTLYHQATHDPLTGLANRNLLYQAFKDYAADLSIPDQKIVILFIDLDHFKRINNTLGHDVGDQLLIISAKRLTASLRGNDLASRLGGDEFVVMLVDIEKTQIESIASRIFKSINRPITYDNHEIYLSCSMGVCVYPNDGSSIEQLIKLADLALYHAKENGRNHYQFYSESLNADLNETHQKEIELQRALDEHQLTLYYQPIYDLKTKQIVSMEALIRWHHPTQGLLGADEIIPFAERSELIYPISDWVLKTVCAQSKIWQDKSLPIVPIAVNLSAVQLKEISISEKIITYIREAGIKPCHLEIEITETGFIDITPRIISELNNLKAAGIMLTIDDFGTGYAGLGYLKKLPVGKLKIDQSFIRDIQIDPDDKAITLAIIAIAHQLNLKVTAEGVENVEQYNFMCYHQVDEVQGFFLSKPMSVEDCEKLLTGTETKPIR
jgi:diguanylate cyclase (GGDEF)-like protein